METILPAKPSQFLGLFFVEKHQLWAQVQILAMQSKSWIYITDEHPVHEVRAALDFKNILSKGEIFISSDFYLREQVVRAKPVISAIENIVANKQVENLTIFCEMTWAVRSPSGDIYLRELHEAFQSYLATNSNTIICLYNESILLNEQLLLGLYSHPQIYTEEGVKENPYFLPAKIIQNNHLKSRFNYWLSNIDNQRQFVYPKYQALSNGKEDFPLEKIIGRSVAQTNEGRWKISCFGELRIRRENGELVDWNTKAGATKKLKTIFAFLLLRGEKGASIEELADLLWKDSDSTDSSLNRLYHTIKYLRTILHGSNIASTKESPFIVQQSSFYYLKLPNDSWVDIPMFQELCYKGNQHFKDGNLEQAKISYESAERIYHGQLFNDIPLKYIDNTDNDWCWSKRTWFHDMYHKLLYSLANIYRQLGQLTQAIYYADKVLSDDPTKEAAQKEKLLALADAGRFDALHRQFKIYTESLRKFNLGAPSQEIKDIYINLSKNN